MPRFGLVYLLLTAGAFAYLNCFGWLKFRWDHNALGDFGWPATIAGLSPSAAVPVPDVSVNAIVFDAVLCLCVLVAAGFTCRRLRHIEWRPNFRLRTIFIAVGVAGTWAAVFRAEYSHFADVFNMLFEFSRLWVLAAIVVAWCAAAASSKPRP